MQGLLTGRNMSPSRFEKVRGDTSGHNDGISGIRLDIGPNFLLRSLFKTPIGNAMNDLSDLVNLSKP
jgi:hypothetical protein